MSIAQERTINGPQSSVESNHTPNQWDDRQTERADALAALRSRVTATNAAKRRDTAIGLALAVIAGQGRGYDAASLVLAMAESCTGPRARVVA